MRFDLGLALEILPDLLGALLVTIEAALLGIVLALAIGLVWAMLRRSARAWVAAPISWLVDFLRSTPLLIQLYFLYFGLPALGVSVGPLPTGIAALGLHYSAYVAEVYRAGIDGVPRGQWEAARALGFGRWQTWQRVVLPQAIPPVVPALGNYLISMFKDTPLLAAITVTELLQTAKIVGAERFRYLEPLTLVGALFLVVSVLAGRSVRWLEARFEVRHG